MSFVVSLFVHHLSFLWCLGKTVLRDCGNSYVSLPILKTRINSANKFVFVRNVSGVKARLDTYKTRYNPHAPQQLYL